MVRSYLESLHETCKRGDAREESFYGSLKDLINEYASHEGIGDCHVTTQPRPTDAGNPDFRVWNGRDRITGYIEAKPPTTDRLDPVEDDEQLERYRDTFPNLILTNFCEFRLYRDGELVDQVVAGQPRTLTRVGAAPPPQNVDELWELLEKFFSFSLPRSYTAESLAEELAKRTRFFRDVVEDELENPSGNSSALRGFHEAFQTYLIGSLSPEQFADLYAQTVTYGLFAARMRTDGGFNRRAAHDAIPHTIGILRDVFRYISLEEPPEEVQWIVDDIAHCLAAADPGGILDRYYRDGKGSDPIVHFYETFLAEYDPEERERRGVFYTPEPVVSYIVRSLHRILKDEFGMSDGLASEDVTLLDPAAGTMTFVARAAQQAVEEYQTKYGDGSTEEFICDHILEHFYAFELMMAPYAVGHLKMSFFLEELGHQLQPDERFQLYLTNSLEMEDLEQTQLPGMSSLADESREAGRVKKDQPILVILGNPPYSGHSANKGDWITARIEDYKQVDGQPLDERNPKWLQDDYVKFLRFAQWKIDRAGRGVVGMITNHSYLDNPTFRGMRQSLMQTFDEIYVLDLHGNSLKRETCPDGSKDENVFDIRQGVAIAFFVKKGEDGGPAPVQQQDLWGLRESKYEWLTGNDIASTEWQEIVPKSEFCLFVPRDETALDRYDEFVKVTDLFPVHSVGIVTSRDNFVIDFDKEALQRRIRQFRDPNVPDDIIRRAFNLNDKQNWVLSEARTAVMADEQWAEKLQPCLYRPFDVRWLFYSSALVERGREEVMRHMLAKPNFALIVPRQHKNEFGAYVTRTIGTHKTVAVYDINYYFPLYLSQTADQNGLLARVDNCDGHIPNLTGKALTRLRIAYGSEPSPEQVLRYIYALLYAASYREKYAAFLRIDFPRIPFAAHPDMFVAMGKLGKRLVALHLLDSPELDPPVARFEGDGDNTVARRKADGFRYDSDAERMYINESQYFGPVPPELWEYRIGGYQVLHKWLKDRKERRLNSDDIRTYCRIVTALQKTIEIQEEIDALYLRVEEDILELDLSS